MSALFTGHSENAEVFSPKQEKLFQPNEGGTVISGAANPFLIIGPALISFSGGRTSAYMLWRILQAHGGTLPGDVVVAFANTGKEREETLRFVQECGDRWGAIIQWLERDPASLGGYNRKTFQTASRAGEPFDALIASKKALPNWQARWCTGELKVKPILAYMDSRFDGPVTEVIGLRADEGPRVLKMYARNDQDGRRCVAPLSKASVGVRDVRDFWNSQSFDLALRPGEGNCDLCFMKGRGLKKAIIRQNPASADWWAAKEVQTDATFDRRDSVAELAAEVRQSPTFFDGMDDDEHDVECGLLCGEAS